MKTAIYFAFGGVLCLLLLVFLMTRIYYRIGSRHLKIILFGIPIRRVPLNKIVHASKREPRRIAERWQNTVKPSHRLLTIEKEGGLFKYLCITPRNRYVFLADLKNAVRRVNPGAEWAKTIEGEHPTDFFTTRPAEQPGADPGRTLPASDG